MISIIAILAAMLLPTLSKAKFKAKTVACMSRQHQLYIGVTLYADDNEDSWPTPNQWGADYGKVPILGGRRMSLGLTWDYIQDGRVYQCPTLYSSNNGSSSEATWAKTLNTAMANESGSASSSYYLERVWDGNSVNHTVEQPRKKPHFGYRFMGSKFSANVDNVSQDNRRFAALPMLQCHQCPYWHYNMTHEGKGANLMFTDGTATWFQYNYAALNHHTINVSWNTLIAQHGK